MTRPTPDVAQARPTKKFFVSMLTRDISLADAILDLLDNCLDGALRIAQGSSVDYSKHSVTIEINGNYFSIEDNCGGIPRDVAKDYAFKIGRESDDDRDSDTETIGMYGVGMKRAIFKMGKSAIVRTNHGGDNFEVPITSDWLETNDWTPLPINEPSDPGEKLQEPGTLIRIDQLYEGVARHFDSESFENDVRTAISEHFTVFLQSGFQVKLNGKPVDPVRIEVLVSEREGDPAPFVFQKTIQNVLVSIAVGLNTSRHPTEDEDEELDFEGDRTSATAGWTVLCNDRAVIVGDKSRLTGWGDGIPLYHPQFSIISGIIEFRSKHAEQLPVTTTKRALDTSSNVWLESLVKMKEGMRMWITHTNQWKNHPRSDQTRTWENSRPLPLNKAIEAVKNRAEANVTEGSIEFNPQKLKLLKKPEGKTPSSRRITFSRPIEEIQLVSKMLFDINDEKPGIVGETCFEIALSKAQQK